MALPDSECPRVDSTRVCADCRDRPRACTTLRRTNPSSSFVRTPSARARRATVPDGPVGLAGQRGRSAAASSETAHMHGRTRGWRQQLSTATSRRLRPQTPSACCAAWTRCDGSTERLPVISPKVRQGGPPNTEVSSANCRRGTRTPKRGPRVRRPAPVGVRVAIIDASSSGLRQRRSTRATYLANSITDVRADGINRMRSQPSGRPGQELEGRLEVQQCFTGR